MTIHEAFMALQTMDEEEYRNQVGPIGVEVRKSPSVAHLVLAMLEEVLEAIRDHNMELAMISILTTLSTAFQAGRIYEWGQSDSRPGDKSRLESEPEGEGGGGGEGESEPKPKPDRVVQ